MQIDTRRVRSFSAAGGASVSKATFPLFVDVVATKDQFDGYELDSDWSEGTRLFIPGLRSGERHNLTLAERGSVRARWRGTPGAGPTKMGAVTLCSSLLQSHCLRRRHPLSGRGFSGHLRMSGVAFDLASGVFEAALGAMLIPSCSIIDMRFQCAHSSAILEPSIRKMVVPETETFLLVGDMPRNCPLCVPVPVQWTTTSSRSAMVSSIVNLRSGNPLRQLSMWRRRLSAPELSEGNTGSWIRQLAATSSETASSFPWLQHSSINLRAICLLSVACMVCAGMCRPSLLWSDSIGRFAVVVKGLVFLLQIGRSIARPPGFWLSFCSCAAMMQRLFTEPLCRFTAKDNHDWIRQ